MQCLTDKQTVDLISGFLNDEEAVAATAHAGACRSCASRLRDLADIRENLGALPGEFEDKALCSEIMTLIDLGRGEKARLPAMRRFAPWHKWLPIAAATAAAAVFLSVALFQFGHPPKGDSSVNDPDHFARRGGAPTDDQWVSLTLFERRDVNGRTVYRPVSESLSTHAALAVAYEDRSASPFPYLMVLAVDSEDAVFWYYPEYDETGADRFSIAASKVQGKTSLPDEVTHEFSPGPLRFFGIFSRSPLSARETEATVKRQLRENQDLSALTRIDVDGTGQWTKLVHVVREGE